MAYCNAEGGRLSEAVVADAYRPKGESYLGTFYRVDAYYRGRTLRRRRDRGSEEEAMRTSETLAETESHFVAKEIEANIGAASSGRSLPKAVASYTRRTALWNYSVVEYTAARAGSIWSGTNSGAEALWS